MTASTQWQLAREAAAQYERVLVPWILGPAARTLVERAGLERGQTVLDVGCGTGAAARFAAAKVGTAGQVIGIDVNAGMIEVARSRPAAEGAPIAWHTGSAYALPLEAERVDVVLCAQTVQFLADRAAALAEMYRVLRPGGRLGVSVWSALHESPYFHALVEAMAGQVGEETAAGLRSAFGFSEAAALRTLIEQAGFRSVTVAAEPISLELPAPTVFVPVHIGATPMAAGYGAAAPEVQASVVAAVAGALARYRHGEGLRVPFTTHVATALK